VIRLRPHHLLCILTYAGKGYSPAFVANYDTLAARIGAGEDVLLVSGPDDICAPLLGEADAHCFNTSVTERDRLASRDVGTLWGKAVAEGDILTLDAARLKRMREAFATQAIRSACPGCEWHDLCTGIAAQGFGGTRIAPC
jgi:hypothetical protein